MKFVTSFEPEEQVVVRVEQLQSEVSVFFLSKETGPTKHPFLSICNDGRVVFDKQVCRHFGLKTFKFLGESVFNL